MIPETINILLADDDKADCLLFKEALEALPLATRLSIAHNGEQLLDMLSEKGARLPDVLFLDLNMPRKNGFASLSDIKHNSGLQDLPVVIYSTLSELEAVKRVFSDAAHYYICKPDDFSQLKKMIHEALIRLTQNSRPLPLKENFMIKGDLNAINN